jgi:hypothetical protein
VNLFKDVCGSIPVLELDRGVTVGIRAWLQVSGIEMILRYLCKFANYNVPTLLNNLKF